MEELDIITNSLRIMFFIGILINFIFSFLLFTRPPYNQDTGVTWADVYIDNILRDNNFDYWWLDLKSPDTLNIDYTALSIEEYLTFVAENYVYEKDKYNCQYWAYFHARYFSRNGYDVRYVLTETHIFTIATNQNEYWIADGINLHKVSLLP